MSKDKQSYPPLYDRPHPWLFLSHGKRKQIHTFYNVAEGRYVVKSIPELLNKCICDCPGTGWMFLEADNMIDDYCCLYNIITQEKVELPPRIEYGSTMYNNCIITCSLTNPDCRVIFYTYTSDLITCKVGDSSFVTKALDPESFDVSLATMIKGKIYGMLSQTRSLAVADNLEEASRFRSLGLTPHPEMKRGSCGGYLIDFPRGILLVQKVMFGTREEVSFNVFLANFSEMAWVKLNKIGNHAIFLERFRGFTCSTTGLSGVKPNCIYYIDGKMHDRKINVFDMVDQSLTITLPCHKVSANCSILRWIVMPAGSSPSPASPIAALYKKIRSFIQKDE